MGLRGWWIGACVLLVLGCSASDGKDGADGMDGPPGMDGMDGTNGPPGMDGMDGMDGTNGPPGMDGMDGMDGTNGLPGMDGMDGADGVTSYAALTGTPTLSPVATSGDYADLTGTPTLSAVATSGDYADLTGTPTLSAVATSGDYADLINVPAELDAVFTASPAATIDDADIAAWQAAYAWGDHSSVGYITAESDSTFLNSPAASITPTHTVQWSTAYGWGDHAAAGYLSSEVDPVFAASTAASITPTHTGQWSTAYGWGDHAAAGYLTSESDPAFAASPAASITPTHTGQWSTAYGWGDHAAAGYLSTSGGTLTGALGGTSASFSEGVQVGNDTNPCDPARMGTLRFDPAALQLAVCDGTRWAPLQQYFLGQTASDPGESCLDILTNHPTAPSGAYWLLPPGYGGSAFITWCDMETDGGGWTMVGKVSATRHDQDNGVLDGADTNRWINGTYLGDMSDLDTEDALGPAYESVAFNDFMLMGLHDPSKKLAWTHNSGFTSLQSVFSSPTVQVADALLVGDFSTLDYRAPCPKGLGPDATGPEFYGFNIRSDGGAGAGASVNGFNAGWCSALAGWGRTNTAAGYTGGGLGAMCQGRTHQMARHVWGYGEACDTHDWGAARRFVTFHGHAFFVR